MNTFQDDWLLLFILLLLIYLVINIGNLIVFFSIKLDSYLHILMYFFNMVLTFLEIYNHYSQCYPIWSVSGKLFPQMVVSDRYISFALLASVRFTCSPLWLWADAWTFQTPVHSHNHDISVLISVESKLFFSMTSSCHFLRLLGYPHCRFWSKSNSDLSSLMDLLNLVCIDTEIIVAQDCGHCTCYGDHHSCNAFGFSLHVDHCSNPKPPLCWWTLKGLFCLCFLPCYFLNILWKCSPNVLAVLCQVLLSLGQSYQPNMGSIITILQLNYLESKE